MATVTIHEAKTHLSRLIERARGGEEIVIAKGKEPVVRLTVITERQPRRVFGSLRGKLVDHGIDDPLPEEELRLWEGGTT